MYKVKQFVRHKTFGKNVIMQILDVSENDKNKEFNVYHCRYFDNGVFYAAEFYQFELELTD